MSWNPWQWPGINPGPHYTPYYPYLPGFPVAPVVNMNPRPQFAAMQFFNNNDNCDWVVETPTTAAQMNQMASTMADVGRVTANAMELVQRVFTGANTASGSVRATFGAVSPGFVGITGTAGPLSSTITWNTSSSIPPTAVGTTRTAGPTSFNKGNTSNAVPPVAVSSTGTAGPVSSTKGDASAAISPTADGHTRTAGPTSSVKGNTSAAVPPVAVISTGTAGLISSSKGNASAVVPPMAVGRTGTAGPINSTKGMTSAAIPPTADGPTRTAGPLSSTKVDPSAAVPPVAVGSTGTAGLIISTERNAPPTIPVAANGTTRSAGPISSTSGTTYAIKPPMPVCTSGTASTGGIQSIPVAVKSLGTTNMRSCANFKPTGRVRLVPRNRKPTTCTTITKNVGGIIANTASSKKDSGQTTAVTASVRTAVGRNIVTRSSAASYRTQVCSKGTPLVPTTAQKALPTILKQINGHTLLMYVYFKLRSKLKSSLQRRIAENFHRATAIQFSQSTDADDCTRIHLRFPSKRNATSALKRTKPIRFIYKAQGKTRSVWLTAIKYEFIQSPSASPLPKRKRVVELSETSESEEEEYNSHSPSATSEDESDVTSRVEKMPHSPTASLMIDASEFGDDDVYEISDDESD